MNENAVRNTQSYINLPLAVDAIDAVGGVASHGGSPLHFAVREFSVDSHGGSLERPPGGAVDPPDRHVGGRDGAGPRVADRATRAVEIVADPVRLPE